MKIKGLICVLAIMFIVACDSNSVPKPRGYYRIDLPEKNYQDLGKQYPFDFKYPSYGQISEYEGKMEEGVNTNNWLNIDFVDFKAHLYLTFKPVEDNLAELIEDSYSFVYKHISKADAINQIKFVSPETSVYGILFDIKGNTASSLQFYITDSVANFLRGALYFDCEPNMDSLAPMISFFKKDIEVLMESFNWK